MQLTVNQASLQTCDPLVMDISGGQKPYKVMIAAANSPAVTNVTMGPNDDEYTWIDRAAPGSTLVGMSHRSLSKKF